MWCVAAARACAAAAGVQARGACGRRCGRQAQGRARAMRRAARQRRGRQRRDSGSMWWYAEGSAQQQQRCARGGGRRGSGARCAAQARQRGQQGKEADARVAREVTGRRCGEAQRAAVAGPVCSSTEWSNHWQQVWVVPQMSAVMQQLEFRPSSGNDNVHVHAVCWR